MAPKKIPDRWLDYRPINQVIQDARLVPFKTPLPESKFQSEPFKSYRWTPRDLIHYLSNHGYELGLIIDFTNKYPAYYDTREFTDNGIDFVKVGCIGHDVPSETNFSDFNAVVETFLERNRGNNRVIGVHCTHGVNRTGYMLCRHLIQKYGYSPKEAIDCFSQRRGYPIERDNYIDALWTLNKQ